MPLEEKLKHARNFLSYLAMRDLRFAGQILKQREKEPAAFIMTRGTGHIGLVPSMEVLSGETFPGADLIEPHTVSTSPVLGIIIPTLWQKHFWQEVIGENHLNVSMTGIDSVVEKVGGKIRKKLQEMEWNTVLCDQVAELSADPNRNVTFILRQQPS